MIPESTDQILRKSICDFARNHANAESDIERVSTNRMAMEFIMKTVRMDTAPKVPTRDLENVYESDVREIVFHYINIYENEKVCYNGRNNS